MKYIKLFEDNKDNPKFKVGDIVIMNNNLQYYININNWRQNMILHVGQEFVIKAVAYDIRKMMHAYYLETPNGALFIVNEDCLDVKEDVKEQEEKQIRWYKKGKLENE